jgi:hypothetical protein
VVCWIPAIGGRSTRSKFRNNHTTVHKSPECQLWLRRLSTADSALLEVRMESKHKAARGSLVLSNVNGKLKVRREVQLWITPSRLRTKQSINLKLERKNIFHQSAPSIERTFILSSITPRPFARNPKEPQSSSLFPSAHATTANPLPYILKPWMGNNCPSCTYSDNFSLSTTDTEVQELTDSRVMKFDDRLPLSFRKHDRYAADLLSHGNSTYYLVEGKYSLYPRSGGPTGDPVVN